MNNNDNNNDDINYDDDELSSITVKNTLSFLLQKLYYN